MRTIYQLGICLVTLFSAVPTMAAVPPVAREINDAMQDRDYERAVTAIDKSLESDDQDTPRDYLTYLKGRALHYQEKYAEAVKVFAGFAEQFPDSPWARRVRLAAAVSHARLKGFQAAEEIYRREAEYLLSLDRKDEIAGVYLAFADQYFAPKRIDKKPDFEKALEFYKQALAVQPRPERKAYIDLQIGRCFQELKNFDEAIKQFTAFGENHAESEHRIEAKYQLGASQLQQGQLPQARRTWQDLLRDHGDAESPRLPEAAFNIAKTHSLPNPGSPEDLSLGITALQQYLKQYPDHASAGDAQMLIANSYQNRGQYAEATKTLEQFLADARYQDNNEIPEARYQLGVCHQRQKQFDKALETWRDYLTKHPSHQRWSAAQKAIVDTEYAVAADRQADKKYAAARQLWNAFLAKYPLDGRASQIMLGLGQMYYDQQKWQAAIEDWRRIVAKYPQSDHASAAQMRIGLTLETKLDDFEQAIAEYKKLDWGNQAQAARERLQLLTNKRMQIRTERVFRTDQQPEILLTSRNIEKFTVRCYQIDLETYFRKMHLATGVESLDVSLIDPDETFEFEVPEYTQYRQTQHPVPLPAPGNADQNSGGVLIVTVSSDKLEATTMVLQSDLDMVVKSSRDEVFVFAQNMRTGKAWPGARLLVSDGSKVVTEAQTGDDGVWHETLEALKDTKDIRVFAIAENNTASNVVGLEGLQPTQGLTQKGYIYTDRAMYRPGQLVNLRGIVRSVADDTYQIEQNKSFDLTIFDPRNRAVWEQQVTLNDFGSFHANYLLPLEAAVGQYRISVNDNAKQVYQGAFAVSQYKLENIQLSVDTERTVFYRGETITGKIVAKYYFGSPLVDREVRYQLANGRSYTARTNDRGEIEFELPTDDFRASQIVPLVVQLPENNVTITKPFILATQGFGLQVGTQRAVYLSGESFEVTVTAIDAEGKPTEQDLKLTVLERTVVAGQVGERVVSEHKLNTDKETGIGRVSLTLKDGGTYILRAAGTDRFENAILGQHVVQISGEDDKTRLRLLADQFTYKVGDTAEITIHWREEPALALVTFQGAKVLDYELIQLYKGKNRLMLPMAAEFAPNFELNVCVMRDATAKVDDDGTRTLPVRFHAASGYFQVARDLVVNIKRLGGNPNDPALPGEAVEFEVETTDPQGAPLASEVSLAMIEQAAHERFGAASSPLSAFFHGVNRQISVRTAASISFAYQPTTKAIDVNLLTELERRALEESEAASRSAMSRMDYSFGVSFSRGESTVENLAVPFDSESSEASGSIVAHDQLDAALGYTEMVPEVRRRSINYTDESGQQRTREEAYTVMVPGRSRSRANRQNWGIQRGAQLAVPQFAEAGYSLNGPAAPTRGFAGGGFGSDVTISEGFDGRVVRLEPRQAFARHGEQRRGGQLATQAYPVADFVLPIENESVLEGVNRPVVFQKSLGDYYKSFATFDVNGTLRHYASADFDGDGGVDLARALADSGTVVMPHLSWQETGYWNPSIRTQQDGKAKVTFTVPDRSTAWELIAHGITKDTLAGQGNTQLVARKDLSGELKLPMAFTDGDRATILATVHNHKLETGSITVTLKTTVGDRTSTQTQTIEVSNKENVHDVPFQVELTRPTNAEQHAATDATFTLILAASDSDLADRFERTVPIQPFGIPVFGTASGTAGGDTSTYVQLPTEIPATPNSLKIVIGPTVERGLLDILYGPTLHCATYFGNLASQSDTAASDLMAAVALQELVSKSRSAGHPQLDTLDQRIRSTVSLLVSTQNDDGGWGWAQSGTSNRYASARTVWALSLAKHAGYALPKDTADKAAEYLTNQIAATGRSDDESKAILMHALAVAGSDDFPLANRLFRNRPALSNAALLHLALGLAEMDRKPMAGEVLDVIVKRNLDETTTRRNSAQSSLPWNHSPTELRALLAVALQQVRPSDAAVKDHVQWLMEHRVGNRWTPDKATGPATLAVSQWYAKSQFTNEHYKLAVFVNNERVAELDVGDETHTQAIGVPTELIANTKRHRVHFEMTGRGRFSYQCVLEGFASAENLASTTKDWHVRRIYEAAPLERDGKPIPRGFNVINGSYSSFRNLITQLPVGRRGHVELRVWRDGVTSDIPEEHLEYLVVTEPLPSGVTVVRDSIAGGFERYEIQPGSITFFVGNRRYIGNISFDVHGYLAGTYQAGPPVVRDAYRPDRLAVHAPTKLAVLTNGEETKDTYRLTPRELFELGKLHFAKREFAAATKHLDDLIENWRLKPEVLRETTQMSLDARLEIGPAAQVVKHFEVIKEKWPDLEIPYDKILKIGAAYHDMGEFERCFLIFRATVESSFLTESRVAGFLEKQNESLRSVEYMEKLLAEYPPEPYVAAANFDLAQRVFLMAPTAATDEQLKERKINRVDLLRRSAGMLGKFLTAYPKDPAADQAAFSLATALLELEQYDSTINACEQFIKRYPESDNLDSFWYTIGYCHFAKSNHDQALAVCRKVSEMTRRDPKTGRMAPAENRDRAVYILGQIYHSLGQAREAIEQYQRVQSQFSDAGEAIRYFTRRDIKLPEVTTFLPQLAANRQADKPNEATSSTDQEKASNVADESVPFVLPLSFRNVAECVVKVYRIDLMKFGLLERNLGGIRDINLAGIKPYHEATLKLGDGHDYRDRNFDVKLPLTEEGAYLVVCRGGDLHTSGMVLVSPLTIDVQEDTTSGRVRTTVQSKSDNRYLSDIDVKVIGSRNDTFVSGKSDLRGVFVADEIRGTATVIAQATGGQYAFYRGTRSLGPDDVPQDAEPQEEMKQLERQVDAAKEYGGKRELLKGLRSRNTTIQSLNLKRQQEQYFNEESGVRVEAVK